MLQEVSRPDLDIPALEKLIKAEASVCYRLLRYLNSAAFGIKSESPLRAARTLDAGRARRSALGTAGRGGRRRPGEDQRAGAVGARARDGSANCCRPQVQHGESDLFLLGLLSLIDVMLETPMAEVLEKIPLDHAKPRPCLLGQPSPLRPVFQLILAHESGEWQAAAELSESLHLKPEEVAAYYWQAQQWARELSQEQ